MPVFYRTNVLPLVGSDYREIHRRARIWYADLIRHSRRRPYVRSAFFKKEKVFLSLFWHHAWDKNWRDRVRRLQYLPCAINLIKNSRIKPTVFRDPTKPGNAFYRFYGVTAQGEMFVVQIQQRLSSGRKDLLSIFPIPKQKIPR